MRKPRIFLILVILIAFLLGLLLFNFRSNPGVQLALIPSVTPSNIMAHQEFSQNDQEKTPVVFSSILLDDFNPQPYRGDSIYFYNRLGGDRGAINDSILEWKEGQVKTIIGTGKTWGGVWMSMNHPIWEANPINFSAVFPPEIDDAYQSQITGVSVSIADGTPGRILKLELKDGSQLRWEYMIQLNGEKQLVEIPLSQLGNVNHFVWVLDQANPGDFVVIENIKFNSESNITDTAMVAFVWSYGMLLNNWNPETGLVRDKAKDPSGNFDAIQATGSLAAATVIAEQLGVVSTDDAIRIVNKISEVLLLKIPRFHGLWPHWVRVTPTGDLTIVENTEWSTVDTVIAAISLLCAQSGLGLNTAGTTQMLQGIDWASLELSDGISHGFMYSGELIEYSWDVFGGESWLVALVYASVNGVVPAIKYPAQPTANGSGFIDELAWLFVPPPEIDYWGNEWLLYRMQIAEVQKSYFQYNSSQNCFTSLGFFGLSAAEVPDPSGVPKESIYQAFGVGGQFSDKNDGTDLLGQPVFAPHYIGMIASLFPDEAVAIWEKLISFGLLSPLNNVESLMFTDSNNCAPETIKWNHLKGSWNLALQALGWGRYLAEREGQVPILWQALAIKSFLKEGYGVMTGIASESSSANQEIEQKSVSGILSENSVTIANLSCDESSLQSWFMPGRYVYKNTNKDGDVKLAVVFLRAGENRFEDCPCCDPWPNYGARLPEPPNPDLTDTVYSDFCETDSSVPPGSTAIKVIGPEELISEGVKFELLRVESVQQYFFNLPPNFPEGTITTNEWYICGLGLVYSKMVHIGKYQGRPFEKTRSVELTSFSAVP